MNSALHLISFLAVVCLSLAASPEYKTKVISSLTACAKDYNVNMNEVKDVIKNDKLPETKEQKCVAGCFMTKMGYVTDSKIDWAKVKALNPEKYEAPELVEKANQVADACAKVVTEETSEVCEIGLPAMKCMMEEAKKINLPKPDVKLE